MNNYRIKFFGCFFVILTGLNGKAFADEGSGLGDGPGPGLPGGNTQCYTHDEYGKDVFIGFTNGVQDCVKLVEAGLAGQVSEHPGNGFGTFTHTNIMDCVRTDPFRGNVK